MKPTEKAAWLIKEMEGGCCRCPNDAKEAAITCINEIIQAMEIGLAKELIVDDPSKPMEEMEMIGGIEYWKRVRIGIYLVP